MNTKNKTKNLHLNIHAKKQFKQACKNNHIQKTNNHIRHIK